MAKANILASIMGALNVAKDSIVTKEVIDVDETLAAAPKVSIKQVAETEEKPKGKKVPSVKVIAETVTEETKAVATQSRKDFAASLVHTDSIPAGTINGTLFLQLCRDAGKREKTLDNGRKVMAPATARERDIDLKLAVASYIGLKKGDIFGTRLETARRRALLEFSPQLGETRNRATASVHGYVAGMPQPLDRIMGEAKTVMSVLGEQLVEAIKAGGEGSSEVKDLRAKYNKLDKLVKAYEQTAE